MASPASTLDAPRRADPKHATPTESTRHPLALDLALLGALTAAVVVVFGAVHRELQIRQDAAFARLDPYISVPGHPLREVIQFSSGAFLAVLVGSIGLALLRHRLAAVGVFVLAAMTPLLQSVLGVLPTDRPAHFRVAPTALGTWVAEYLHPELGQLWRGFAIDYGLALLPAIAIIGWSLAAERPTRARGRVADVLARVRRPSASEIIGLAVSAFLFWLFLHTWELRETLQNNGASSTGTDLVAFIPYLLLGAVLARGTRWRFVVLAAVPILWSTAWVPTLLLGGLRGPSMSDAHDALPFVGAMTAGALWYPIASLVDGDRIRPWALVVALNALNLADVLFTKGAVHSGQAVEANPFAAWIGPGVKVIGVGAASLLLARFRPRALVWLVVVFGALTAWHLSGLLLDTT